jgi:starch phosphorylase
VTLETLGDEHAFEVEVYVDDLDPGAVQIELYANGIEGGPPVRQQMERAGVVLRVIR